MTSNTIMWQPTIKQMLSSHMAKFMQFVNDRYNAQCNDYQQLHQWSITHLNPFWKSVWEFTSIIAHTQPNDIYLPKKTMRETEWFGGATLNFAQNLLRYFGPEIAIRYEHENGRKRTLTYDELRSTVTTLAYYLENNLQLNPGERVAAILPNCPETVIAMLATTSLGGLWTACSPDFGLTALQERFVQIQPSVLFCTTEHEYHGKRFTHHTKLAELVKQLPSLRQIIVIDEINNSGSGNDNTHVSANFSTTVPITTVSAIIQSISATKPSTQPLPPFRPLPFNHPLYILYSSGTTNKPKCMVHSAGGTLVQHLKELMLHTNLNANDTAQRDTLFFYTTCGWMMWHWMISSLALKTTLVLYEGSPFYPTPNRLYDLIDQHQITHWGVGASIIEKTAKQQLSPIRSHSLHTLKTILTTGSPLLPHQFDYIVNHIKTKVQISSISGGSDIISCFALGNPLLPVYRGTLQCVGLGMDVKIFDTTGQPVFNKKGELVCTSPFPSMPLYFWGDEPNGSTYNNAYFTEYPNVWAHGDYAKLTPEGNVIIYGRSDATLNPGGIRIGTAEIYQPLERLAEITECLATSKHIDGVEQIILFVVLAEATSLDETLSKKIKQTIRKATSPHHVPAKIIAVKALPRTLNGKLAELAVKNVLEHRPVNNLDALANPETLAYFKINLDDDL